jgi:adenylate cyclase
VCAAIVLASALAARALSGFRFFEVLDHKGQDLHFVVRGAQPTRNIVLVTADDKALREFSELRMFWHLYYAQAIKAASEAGAKVIALDVAFGVPVEKWEPDYDRTLGEAVATSAAPVVCGFVAGLDSTQNGSIPINMFSAALGLSAFVNLSADPDDFIRRQELIEAPSKDPAEMPHRSMGLKIAEKYLGADAVYQNGKLSLAGHPIPIASDRSIIINFAGAPGVFPRVSLADFIAAARAGNKQQLRDWVAGKAVLIGPYSDTTLEDRSDTPFYSALGGQRWTTPGVEIHASTLRTILERDYILPVPEWLRFTALLAIGAATIGIATGLATGPAIAWGFVELIVMLTGTHLLFLAGRILYTWELMAAATICLIGSIIYRFSTAEKRRDLFRKAVSLFVGKQLAGSIDSTEDIELSGKRLNVTILFTDIRGFTAFSEKLCDEQGPEALVKLLNEYMSQMVAIIVRYGGQVNKFIGDGILAIFSDDDEGAVPGDHAIRAVRCANEMVTAPSQFSTGSGIHTGIAIVGNIGSADKMEYTVLGDTVNLASRLESLNKEHHTKLLMSEATQVALHDQVETVHLAAVPVRGKTAPINLFTVASLVAPAETSKAVVNA